MCKPNPVSFLYYLLFTAGLYFVVGGCSNDKKAGAGKSLVYIKGWHDNDTLYTADSFFLAETYDSARVLYTRLLQSSQLPEIQQSYLASQLLVLEKDTARQQVLYQELVSSGNELPALAHLSLAKYCLGHKKPFISEKALRSLIRSAYPNWYKGRAAFLLGRYMDEKLNQLDTAWHYHQLAHSFFHHTGYITRDYQENAEKRTIMATYFRKNLLAIRIANDLFDWPRYYPAADAGDKARAYANRAFMLFREDDVDGTLLDVRKGRALNDSLKDPRTYQELLKSLLVVHMIRQDTHAWNDVAGLLENNIKTTGQDYIRMNRWRGQMHLWSGQNTRAIPYLEKALAEEIRDGIVFSARYSTLCYSLADANRALKKYDKALQYMFANQGRFDPYNRDSMLAVLKQEKIYPFSPAAECARIYLEAYRSDGDIRHVNDADLFLQFVDSLLYKGMKVTEENALLQFYMETGRYYFDAGLHAQYYLYTRTGQQKYLYDFLHYSEKRKNSLLHRDRMLANNESGIPAAISSRELELRSLIKAEKRNGLAGNARFDRLMDEYTALEEEIKKYSSKNTAEILDHAPDEAAKIAGWLPDDDHAIILLDETPEAWYYTLVKKQETTIYRKTFSPLFVDSVLSVVQTLANQQEKPVHEVMENHLPYLFPGGLLADLPKHGYIVADGIYLRLPVEKMLSPDKYAIQSVPSVRWLLSQKERLARKPAVKGTQVAVFAFSDPETVRDTRRTRLTELPGTYKESKRLSEEYPGARVYTGNDATKANFLKVYQDPDIRYIHLALHGKANSSEKDDVKLYFRTRDGGLDSLYGYELLRYRSTCQKVVLSACESGLGKYVTGEGSFSLPRYFYINGAKHVEYHLWDVVD